MKTKNTITRISVLLAASISLLAAPVIMAQATRPDTTATGASAMTPVTASNQAVAPAPSNEEVVQMSVFQVDASRDKGYFAENTLAGSRMRVNVADLGAAISVVTLQQLQDTSSLDVNDVFRYEIGTEGATTYTPQTTTFRVGGLADSIAGNTFGNVITNTVTNATANRVRGLGTPDFALNYYRAISAIPFDTYNASSIEINRGPNSILFGMGSPAGIVNLSMAQASLTKQSGQVQIRVDHRGSNRVSFNYNLPLIKDKLAVYVALLHDDKQYERKPSYDRTNREYVTLTYKPFKSTTIRASVEGYSNNNNRPNSLMPIDGVSEWRNAGEPYYDSKTQQIISNANNQVLGVYAPSIESANAQQLYNYIQSVSGATVANGGLKAATNNYSYGGLNIFGTTLWTTPLLTAGSTIWTSSGTLQTVAPGTKNPFYIPAITFQTGRPVQQIANNAIQAWIQGSVRQASGFNSTGAKQYVFSTTPGAADDIYANNAAAAVIYDRAWTESTMSSFANNDDTHIYGKNYPGVTDTSIYNWKDVNILNMNFGSQRNTNANIELEQEIIPNLLTFSAGWFQQNYHSMQSYTVAQLNATQLTVDTNKYYPDGSPNPYFGDVYVVDQDPDRYRVNQLSNQYRAMLAFTPDFTKNDNWTRWFGRHQVLGMFSYQDMMTTTLRQRLAYYDGSPSAMLQYMADPSQPTFNYQSSATQRRQFYLSTTGDTVTQASGNGINTFNADTVSSSIRMYDYTTGQWSDQPLSMFWPNYNASTGRTQYSIASWVAAWNGYLWNDRIVTTVGVRRDIYNVRTTTTGALDADNPAMTNDQLYQNGYLDTGAFFSRWAPTSRQAATTTSAGVVFKPFINWDSISKKARNNILWEAVENLGFSINKSSNFNPSQVAYVDYFGNPLPKPTGTGKDYGVQVALFKGKLFARLNWFDSSNENVPSSPTAMQRLYWHIDETAYRSWLGFIYMLNNGLDLTSADWKTTAQTYAQYSNNRDVAASTAMEQWTAKEWGLNDWNYYSDLGGTIGGTQKVQAKGTELSVQYNPMPNWTLKLTASKITTVNTDVLNEYAAWKNLRMVQWNAATAANLLDQSVITKYPGINTATGYTAGDGTQVSMAKFWDSFGYYDTTANSETGGMTILNNAADPGYRSGQAYYNAVLMPQEMAALAQEGQQVPDQRKYNVALVTNYNFTHGALKGWAIGGGQRYSSKAIIGYYGKSTGVNKDSFGNNLLDMPDVSRPIYDKEMWYTDLWISYSRKIFSNKIGMKIQLNVADLFQNGTLQPAAVNYDGSVYAYRIMDPRTFILTVTFDF